jgi:hypothetical protein
VDRLDLVGCRDFLLEEGNDPLSEAVRKRFQNPQIAPMSIVNPARVRMNQ